VAGPSEPDTDPLAPVLRALARPGRDSSDHDLNPGFAPAPARTLRAAGVLVPLDARPGGIAVLLTKRSSHLKHHPGQIAFPGGKVGPGDDGPVAAALRESYEEIGLHPSNVAILGTLPRHETVTGFDVTPVVGRVLGPFEPVPEAGEVDEVFAVPLAHLADPGNFRIETRRWKGQDRRYYVVPYGPHYIWGATARILRTLADRIAGAGRAG
jgi:8-oxo-dGTP pyrophosphatase MutT (NUDIX family)